MENINKAIKEAMLERRNQDKLMSMKRLDENWRVGVYKGDLDYEFELIHGNYAVKTVYYDINDISDYDELWGDLINDVAEQLYDYLKNYNIK